MQASNEFDQLLVDGSYEDGQAIGYDYSWNEAIDLALTKSPRQYYANEPGDQWIELRR